MLNLHLLNLFSRQRTFGAFARAIFMSCNFIFCIFSHRINVIVSVSAAERQHKHVLRRAA